MPKMQEMSVTESRSRNSILKILVV